MGGYSYGIHAFLNIFQLKSSKGNVQKVEFVVFDIKWKLFIQGRSGSLFGKSMRRGSIRFQTWLPCQMKFTEIQVKSFNKVPAKPGSQWRNWRHPKGNLSALWYSLIYKSTKFPDTSLWEKDDLLVRCYMDVYIFGVIFVSKMRMDWFNFFHKNTLILAELERLEFLTAKKVRLLNLCTSELLVGL